MQRRSFIALLAAWPALAAAQFRGPTPPGTITPQVEEMRKGWRAYLAKDAKVDTDPKPLVLTKDEWRKRLSPEAYEVLREEDTERPGSSPLNGEKRRGVFVCAGCSWPVFTSAMKYESGTGWPSFFTTIDGAFNTRSDNKIFQTRIEYHCAKCGGHHGHVFDDGPLPTRQRWCNNGVSLRFIPAG